MMIWPRQATHLDIFKVCEDVQHRKVQQARQAVEDGVPEGLAVGRATQGVPHLWLLQQLLHRRLATVVWHHIAAVPQVHIELRSLGDATLSNISTRQTPLPGGHNDLTDAVTRQPPLSGDTTGVTQVYINLRSQGDTTTCIMQVHIKLCSLDNTTT